MRMETTQSAVARLEGWTVESIFQYHRRRFAEGDGNTAEGSSFEPIGDCIGQTMARIGRLSADDVAAEDSRRSRES